MTPTWFSALTGFAERSWAETQAQLEVSGSTLRSRVNGRTLGVGTLETPSLAELRRRVSDQRSSAGPGALRLSIVEADVTDLHRDPANQHATFQVASQFNLLEMTGPDVTPEDGVTRYAFDRTQGPACAIAAGAATIYRNYFAQVDGQVGQTAARQIDCLHDVGAALMLHSGVRPHSGPDQTSEPAWTMRNGYALCTEAGLARITATLAAMSARERDELRGLLRVGVQADVQVTVAGATATQRVTQVFASALPVAYSAVPSARWTALAALVLEGAYEATLLAAALNAARTGCPVVFLTRLGGGAFGNDPAWIDAAMRRALDGVRDLALDVRVVSRGTPSAELTRLVAEFA